MNNEKDLTFLIEQFNQSTLNKSDWTHAAHLTIAIWHVKNYEFTNAICMLRSKIILLNKFHGTENTMHSGYHETLTIFWTKIIALYVQLNPEHSFENLVADFSTSALSNKNIPFQFYKREEILSPDFRAIFHEPTLHEIDPSHPLFR